jgi:hypothetical protein
MIASLDYIIRAICRGAATEAAGRNAVRWLKKRLANGETLVDVARTYGVDATTIGRLAQ